MCTYFVYVADNILARSFSFVLCHALFMVFIVTYILTDMFHITGCLVYPILPVTILWSAQWGREFW